MDGGFWQRDRRASKEEHWIRLDKVAPLPSLRKKEEQLEGGASCQIRLRVLLIKPVGTNGTGSLTRHGRWGLAVWGDL